MAAPSRSSSTRRRGTRSGRGHALAKAPQQAGRVCWRSVRAQFSVEYLDENALSRTRKRHFGSSGTEQTELMTKARRREMRGKCVVDLELYGSG